jgi:DNA polymerase III subunit delta
MARRAATGTSGGKNPGFQELLAQDLKTGNLRPVYVLDGPDQLRIEQVVHALQKLALDPATAAFNEHVLDAEAVGWSGILQQARGYPMLGGRQFVWARHVDRIKTGGTGKIDPGEAAFSAYLQDPVATTVLILSGEKFAGTRGWVKAARKAGASFTFLAPTGRELEQWIARAAQKAGVDLAPPGCELLADLVGNDLQALQVEIEKLALLQVARGHPVTLAELPGLVMDQAQQVVFDLTDAVGPQMGPGALEIWFDLITWGSSVEELSPLLVTHLRRAALVAACLADAEQADAGIRDAGLNPWLVRQKLLPLARRNDAPGWRRILDACLDLERNLKQRPLPPALACEQMICNVHCSPDPR